MGSKSTPNCYGTMAVSIHWLSALLIVVVIASGFRAANTLDPAAKAAILRLHVPIAAAVLALTVLRVVWWWRFDQKPKPVAGSLRWQERAAQVVHALFYVVILGMIASGIGMLALSGAAPMILGGEGALLPDFWKYPPRLPHGIGARLSACLVRASRWCRPLSPLRPPRRSASAHVVQQMIVAVVTMFIATLKPGLGQPRT